MKIDINHIEKKFVITAALAGSSTFRNQNPNVPHTPEEVAEEAYRCYQEGAAVVHLHARDPETGMPIFDPDYIRRVVDAVRSRCPILVNYTSSAGPNAEVRIRPIREIRPDLASLNTGSMNFAGIDRRTGKVLAEVVFENTFTMISEFARTMQELKIKPELEVYDIGHIENVRLILKQGIFEEPLYFNYLNGIAGGIPFSLGNLNQYLDNTPDGSLWTATGVGPRLQPLCNMMSLALGGNVRVGLEDNIWISDGVLAKGSYEQVARAVKMGQTLGRVPATPEEARELLHLPKR
jgi:3-keto-5-aminohexanoate cleavage enzyme